MKEYKVTVTVSKTLAIYAETNNEALSQAEQLITSQLLGTEDQMFDDAEVEVYHAKK